MREGVYGLEAWRSEVSEFMRFRGVLVGAPFGVTSE